MEDLEQTKKDLIGEIINRNLLFVASSLDKEKWVLLKNGIRGPLFFDTSKIIAYPDLMQKITQFAVDTIKDKKISFDLIVGAPYGGLPLSYFLASALKAACLTLRKDGVKKDGTMPTAGEILGIFKKNDKVLIIEDATASAKTVIEFASRLKKAGLEVTDVLAMVDVGKDAIKNLKTENINLHSLFTWKDFYYGYKNKNQNILSTEMQDFFDNMFVKNN